MPRSLPIPSPFWKPALLCHYISAQHRDLFTDYTTGNSGTLTSPALGKPSPPEYPGRPNNVLDTNFFLVMDGNI